MLSSVIISAIITLLYWTNPGLDNLFYFIVGALEGKENSNLKEKQRKRETKVTLSSRQVSQSV